MANTIITPTVIARRALATLYNNAVLAGLVYREYDQDFTGKQGDTVTVRTPAIFTANEFDRTVGIELQDVTEGSFDVTLDTLIDVSFPVTSEEMTLEIDRFDERLLAPAMEAINQDVDGRLAEALVDAAEGAGGGGTVTWDGSLGRTVFTGSAGARAKLGRSKLPNSERYAVLSPEGAGVLLSDELFLRADASGSTDGLREASIGRALGFDTYESQVFGFGPGDRGQADGVAFHRSAVVLTTRTLERPDGVAPNQVAVETYQGLGLRVVKDYDINKKQDVISVDFLCGVAAHEDRVAGAVQLSFGLGS